MNLELITPRYSPRNRREKRLMRFERERIEGVLFPIEDGFYEELFEDNSFSYNSSYQFYLRDFVWHCGFVETTIKPKYHKIDKYYFTKLLYPTELN